MDQVSSQTNRPLLSILIPTRNRAHYLRYAIQSAINIRSSNVEIIVSENYGFDGGWDVANSFFDPRLKVVRPEKPLPMHENWEFLLNLSSGEWVTFIGDDDAVMPHCYDHLLYLTQRYPQAEAIKSPYCHYYWPGHKDGGDARHSFCFTTQEKWVDSKRMLQKCLNGEIVYFFLPQMYSGGFHRRSLVERVTRLQGGTYFKSVTPDAYTALMAVLHTYRYLETGVGMTWVGASPHREHAKSASVTKDRFDDFFGLHKQSPTTLTMHPALLSNNYCRGWSYGIHFYEAYLSAAPFTSLNELSLIKVRNLCLQSVRSLILEGKPEDAHILAGDLGIEVPKAYTSRYYKLSLFIVQKFCNINYRTKRVALTIHNMLFPGRNKASIIYSHQSSDSSNDEDILSCDSFVFEAYSAFQANLPPLSRSVIQR